VIVQRMFAFNVSRAVVVIVVLVASATLVQAKASKLSEDELKAFKKLNTIRLIVNEKNNKKEIVDAGGSEPLKEATLEILDQAGFAVVVNESHDYDATLIVDVEITAFGKTYDPLEFITTGAAINGTISFLLAGKKMYEDNFAGESGNKNPPERILYFKDDPPDKVRSARKNILDAYRNSKYESILAEIVQIVLARAGNVKPLITALEKEDDGPLWSPKVVVLEEIGEPAVMPLIDSINNGGKELFRWRAMEILGSIGSHEIIDILEKISETDPSPIIREAAQKAIHKIQNGH
jgi:hypothetical protein